MITHTTRLIALGIDMFAMSLVFGATAWFFFVQSPVLFKTMGRQRFVPLQMRLAVVFFRVMTIALAVMLVGAIVQRGELVTWPSLTAALALFAVGINKLIILPRALRAGGNSIREREGHDEPAETREFASEGAGQSTTLLHRMVVLFVVVMVVGVVAHGVVLISVTPFV